MNIGLPQQKSISVDDHDPAHQKVDECRDNIEPAGKPDLKKNACDRKAPKDSQ